MLDRGAVVQCRVAALAVMEDLDLVEDRVGQLDAGLPLLAASSSICIDD